MPDEKTQPDDDDDATQNAVAKAAELALAEERLKANPNKKIRLVKHADTIPSLQRILDSYPEELRDSLVLTNAQVLQLVRFSQDRAFGMARTVPLNCKRDDCDFADICMYHKLDIAPENNPCPEEVDLVLQMVPQLIKDLGVDPESYIELNMVQEYVDSIIQEHRAQKYLALTNDIVPRAVAIDPTSGLPVYQDDFAPALNNKEKALRKKERLRKELVATREGRLKYKITNPEDESQKAAEMRRRTEKAIKNAKKYDEEDTEEAEFEVSD